MLKIVICSVKFCTFVGKFYCSLNNSNMLGLFFHSRIMEMFFETKMFEMKFANYLWQGQIFTISLANVSHKSINNSKWKSVVLGRGRAKWSNSRVVYSSISHFFLIFTCRRRWSKFLQTANSYCGFFVRSHAKLFLHCECS